ncbi:Uncharacterised protein [uncultured archaeon]|nr:Uncharacterised protein [uncultured archaeon]
MPPSEFLLCEFLHQNMERVKAGAQVFLIHLEGLNQVYGRIKDYYFGKRQFIHYFDPIRGTPEFLEVYPLSLQKARVRQILGI